MTDDTANKIANLLPTAEKEYRGFQAEYDRLRSVYDDLAAQIAPLEAKQREAEAGMDRLKQRLASLATSMPAVRTLLTTLGS